MFLPSFGVTSSFTPICIAETGKLFSMEKKSSIVLVGSTDVDNGSNGTGVLKIFLGVSFVVNFLVEKRRLPYFDQELPIFK